MFLQIFTHILRILSLSYKMHIEAFISISGYNAVLTATCNNVTTCTCFDIN
jgi:hypothetical protein